MRGTTGSDIVDSGSGPPLCSEDGGNCGDIDPGPDFHLNSKDGGDRDDEGHENSGGVASTSKDLDPPLSFSLDYPQVKLLKRRRRTRERKTEGERRTPTKKAAAV